MPTEPSKAEAPKRKRRWFQFRLRSLMVFTVIRSWPSDNKGLTNRQKNS